MTLSRLEAAVYIGEAMSERIVAGPGTLWGLLKLLWLVAAGLSQRWGVVMNSKGYFN